MAQPNPNNGISEKEWMGQVIDLARTFAWKYYHPWISIHSTKGWPDLALWRERLVLAELKTVKGKVSDYQSRMIEELRAAGVEVYVWRPGDVDEIIAILRRRER